MYKIAAELVLLVALSIGALWAPAPHAAGEGSGPAPATSQLVQAETPAAQPQPTAETQPAPEVEQAVAASPSPTAQPTAPAPVLAAQPPRPARDTLSIPAIGLSAPIVDVGLTATGAIDVPARDVGRWDGSALPGQAGAVFLDGHTPGVFSALHSLRPGHELSVVWRGQTHTYRVVHTETVLLASLNMRRALTPYGGATHGLNLMTCAGAYSPTLGTYDHRLTVYTVQL